MDVRLERDSLGELEPPVEAYYGIHTARARENFPISGAPVASHRELVVARGHRQPGAGAARYRPGEYRHLDPIEHVNLGQSTNDVYPTALRLALRVRLGERRRVLSTLRESLLGKGTEFGSVVKMGRTQLQEAVPMTLGREFAAFTFRDDLARLDQVSSRPV